MILLDFSNAFPSVNHQILINVLDSIGSCKLTLKWFSSFLANWKQSVNWNNKKSESETIKVGVFQGEGSSQLLFTIFINHISEYVHNCSLRQFADDTSITIECEINSNSIENTIKLIDNDLKSISQFCKIFQLSVNSIKSKAIIISSKYNVNKINYKNISPIIINNETIAYTDTVKYLGFNINREFSSSTHISKISQKVYHALSQIQSFKHSLPEFVKLNLIKTLILPIFDYMDVVYHEHDSHGAHGSNCHLQKLFNSAIRFVYNLKYNEHITPFILKSNLVPLIHRRKLHISIMTFKILNSYAPTYLDRLIKINSNNTRSLNKLIINKPKNNQHKNSYYISAPKLWNSIDESIRSKQSIESFNLALKAEQCNEIKAQNNL